MDEEQLAEGGGWFLSILGALVLGVSVGLGLSSYMVKGRFACWVGGQSTNVVNVTAACGDFLGTAGNMTLVSAGGGSVAFFCGLGAMAYAKKAAGGGGE